MPTIVDEYTRGFMNKCSALNVNALALVKTLGELSEPELQNQGLKFVKIMHKIRASKPRVKLLWRKSDFAPIVGSNWEQRLSDSYTRKLLNADEMRRRVLGY